MVLSFKYRKEQIKGGTYYFPKIPVILHSGEKMFPVAALLDSGATGVFIPKHIAEFLGLELKKFEMADSWTGKFKVWESKVGVVVGKSSQTFRQTLPCNVPDQELESDEVILGRTFFSYFEITFNGKQKLTRLKRLTED